MSLPSLTPTSNSSLRARAFSAVARAAVFVALDLRYVENLFCSGAREAGDFGKFGYPGFRLKVMFDHSLRRFLIFAPRRDA